MTRNSFIIFLVVILAVSLSAKGAFAAVTWVSTSPLPPAYIGEPYSFQLQATETLPNIPPVTYSIVPVAGSLPPGLNMSLSGLISGTVNSTGTATFSVRAAANVLTGGSSFVDKVFTVSSFASGVIGPLRIKRLEVNFDNNRPEVTVAKNQIPPRVFARLSFIGSGLLRGYWTVDGAIHSRIQQNLISGSELVLALPAVPPLPTYQTGGHRVRLVITEPILGAVPEAIYYVTEKEKKVFAPIKVISPSDRLDVDFSPLTFSWHLQKNTSAYLVEFLETEDGEPIFSAYTRQANYTIPAHSLRKFFFEKTTYRWKIQAISEDDDIINESDIHRFRFR